MTNASAQPPRWGHPLSDDDYIVLEGSWISREIADAAMLRRVDTHEGREILGQKGGRDCAGILIPYYFPGEAGLINYRIRRDHPDWTEGRDGKLKQERKYLGAPGSRNRLYIPVGITQEQLQDPDIPLVVTEGEKKALALWRLANWECDRPRFIPVAIAGVWNWRGTVGKTGGPKGERLDVKGPIPDLNKIAWDGRMVRVVFDANVHTNDSVKWARGTFAREVATRRAAVSVVNLPADCGMNGVDDLLAAWGPARVLELLDQSVSGTCLQVMQPLQFKSAPEGMYRVQGRGEKVSQTQLSNYRASIKTSITLDDGVETKRELEIEAELIGRRSQFTISAAQFATMDWPIEKLGPCAITFPNQKDYARTAIQSFSMEAEESRIYTHTGWRNVDGGWVFLHADGAIGSAGPAPGIRVALGGPMGAIGCRP